MSEQEIHDICSLYAIYGYTINPDGSIDVNGSVYLSGKGLKRVPVKFNKVDGGFYCNNNNLTSLEGFPKVVGGFFNVSDNNLTSLIGGPVNVKYSYVCSNNELVSLDGGPIIIGGLFRCNNNPLESLNGFNGDYNRLTCHNRDKLIKKNKRKLKLKQLYEL